MFTASKGGGAFLNERRIRVSKCLKLDDALIGTGFPFRVFDHANAYMGIFKDFTERTAGIRRTGSAALDLAYVACGRFDGFWEFGLMPWDMAAGSLLISEAGGLISDLSGGNEDYLKTGNIVCRHPQGLRANAAGAVIVRQVCWPEFRNRAARGSLRPDTADDFAKRAGGQA
jgi:myo-inositol-1(or 4)-monophosphatase